MPTHWRQLAPRLSVFHLAVGALLAFGCGGRDASTSPPPPPQTWTQKASLPGGPLAGAVSFVVQGQIYAGTGFRNGQIWDFYVYDPAGNTWQQVTPFPAPDPRSNAIGFAIGDYGYVGMGYDCVGGGLCTFNYFRDLWRFDPKTYGWTRMADFPGTARAYAVSFVIGDKAYVTGGVHAGDNDLWEYDAATNAWTRKADYPGRCSGGQTAFSIGGKAYVGLGSTNGLCNDFSRYDPAVNSWTAIANFPGLARTNAVGYATGNQGFVIGGAREPSYPNDVWMYNVANDTWSQATTVYPGKGRSQMISAIVNGRIFVGLGTIDETGGPESRFDDFWEYTPAP